MQGFKVEQLPIPKPGASQRGDVTDLAKRLVALSKRRQEEAKTFLGWLCDTAGVDSPGRKIEEYWNSTPPALRTPCARSGRAPAHRPTRSAPSRPSRRAFGRFASRGTKPRNWRSIYRGASSTSTAFRRARSTCCARRRRLAIRSRWRSQVSSGRCAALRRGPRSAAPKERTSFAGSGIAVYLGFRGRSCRRRSALSEGTGHACRRRELRPSRSQECGAVNRERPVGLCRRPGGLGSAESSRNGAVCT